MGRFADATLNRCRSCGRLWLRYLVEYEVFSRSGRWARGLISDEAAQTITPETAAPFLNGLDWYLYGGSTGSPTDAAGRCDGVREPIARSCGSQDQMALDGATD